jgi:glycosyltransferase involved in cell wall biosynthesis
MVVLEYSPDKVLTGILRLTLQVIRALSKEADLYLLIGLPHPSYDVPRNCHIKFIKRNSIRSVFDEDLILEIRALPEQSLKRSELSNATIFYPRWRPSKRFFRREIGVIFDCSPVNRSYDFSDANQKFFLKHVNLSARLNDITITISDFSFTEVLELAEFKDSSLKRIYPGPSFEPSILNRLGRQNSLTPSLNPYCIFIGSLDPRKGLFEILAWWNACRVEMGFQKLILVGGIPSWTTHQHKASVQQALKRCVGVEYLGRVPDNAVLELLTGASLCLYPSKYEGFGLPVCDALFAGIDVLTSDLSATKEFKSQGAILVDPEKPWEWSSALVEDSNKKVSFEELSDRYNWSNYSKEILEL